MCPRCRDVLRNRVTRSIVRHTRMEPLFKIFLPDESRGASTGDFDDSHGTRFFAPSSARVKVVHFGPQTLAQLTHCKEAEVISQSTIRKEPRSDKTAIVRCAHSRIVTLIILYQTAVNQGHVVQRKNLGVLGHWQQEMLVKN